MQFMSFAAVVIIAIYSGFSVMAFWWILIPCFLWASLSVSNGPGFDIVIAANKAGRLDVMPRMIILRMLPILGLGGIIYGVSRLLADIK